MHTAVAVAFLAGLAAAQNFAHPGLVHLGEGRWGTPQEAEAAGLMQYRGRWVAKKLERKLRAWEKQDRRSVEWKDAYKAKTKHYRVTTNVPRFIFHLEIAPFLDELYQTYVKVFREDFGLKGRGANKKFIKIYHGYRDYALHEGADGAPLPRSNPGFIVGNDDLVVYYDETDPAEFYSTVFHEGAHQFFFAMMPGATLPIWLDEALATYFEGCMYSRATNQITVDFLPPDRLMFAKQLLRASPNGTPQSLFMKFPQESFDADHYALAWSFLYYLVHRDGGSKRQGFARFLDDINGSGARPVAEVFERATRESLDEVAKGWRDFIAKLEGRKMPVWVVLGASGEGAQQEFAEDDRVVSFDGVDVHQMEQFSKLWKDRAKDRPIDVVVVRQFKGHPQLDHETKLVTVRIEPGSKLQLYAAAEITRAHCLLD